jgi:predicted DCC family thiol-disulfide oxidoreductase YuxK
MIKNLTKQYIFPENEISIVYDDGCPVCSFYISISHIKKKFGKINFIKARDNQKILDYVNSINIDINEGMIVIFDDKLYYGSDAINILSILGKKTSFINFIIINIFRFRLVSKLLYPLLKIGRRVLLFILGKKLI